MGLHVVRTVDGSELAAVGELGRGARAAAMARRRALAAGRTALPLAHPRARSAPSEQERGAGASRADAIPAAATSVATDGVAAARRGRALSMQRRRQLAQGKQALNGGRTAAAGAPAFTIHRGGAD